MSARPAKESPTGNQWMTTWASFTHKIGLMSIDGTARRPRPGGRPSGAALVTVLLVLVLLLVVGLAFLVVSGADHLFATRQRESTTALYLALAGLEYASRQGWSGPHEEELRLSTGTCRVRAVPGSGPGRLRVTSHGCRGRLEVILEAELLSGALLEIHQL